MSWPLVALSSIAEIVTGNTPSKSEESFFGGDIPFISPSELELGYVSTAKQTLTQKGANVSRLIPANSVMVCCIGSLGKVGITAVPVVTNQQINSLVVNQKLACPLYVYYFCKTLKNTLNDMAPKTTVAIVNKTKFSALQIPLPPLDTQQKIAGVLEKADQLRKDCQQMDQELNSLAQSVFIDMFGENLVSPHYLLGDVSNVVSGVTKGQKHVNKVVVKAPYMRVANVQAGYLNLNEIKDIEVKESDVDKYKLEVGDVLLTEGGDHDKLGRGAIWNGEVENCIHQNHVFRVRLDTSLYTSEWLNGYLKTTFAKRYFLKCAKKTTNLASINITQLKGLPMPKIDMNSQEEFERILNVINQQIITNRQVQEEYSEHFNALMQKAFKSELNL
jgi:type I restriction enzyme S subunit